MILENILDETQTEKSSFAKCKIKYLQAENKLMFLQLNSVCALVDKYKQVIDILSLQPSQQPQDKPETCEDSSEDNSTSR
jgi:hypothetical protein